jgi:hypothetical protein
MYDFELKKLIIEAPNLESKPANVGLLEVRMLESLHSKMIEELPYFSCGIAISLPLRGLVNSHAD